MDQNGKIGRAPDYTTAFLITAGVILFCILALVWVIYGILPALVVAWLVDIWIKCKPFHQNGIKPRQRP